jgi:AraC-like DNA-binding protein
MVNIENISTTEHFDKPQRVLKYILFWCKEGTFDIMVDEDSFTLKKSEAITITSGQYHQLKSVNGLVTVLDFTLDFFCKNDNDIELIFHNSLFCHFGMNEVIYVRNTCFFEETLSKIEKELDEKPYQYLISTHSHIELLLIELNRSKIANGDEIWKPDALFLKFLLEVRTNFSQNYSVAQFAQRLLTTEAKLNEVSKLHTSKTAQNVIYSLIISEAKRLLHYESLTIKEVAYNLGFNDPFYFSNFFKKHTAKSPKEFKKELSV